MGTDISLKVVNHNLPKIKGKLQGFNKFMTRLYPILQFAALEKL